MTSTSTSTSDAASSSTRRSVRRAAIALEDWFALGEEDASRDWPVRPDVAGELPQYERRSASSSTSHVLTSDSTSSIPFKFVEAYLEARECRNLTVEAGRYTTLSSSTSSPEGSDWDSRELASMARDQRRIENWYKRGHQDACKVAYHEDVRVICRRRRRRELHVVREGATPLEPVG